MQIGFMYRSLLILPLSFITWMSRKDIPAHLGVVIIQNNTTIWRNGSGIHLIDTFISFLSNNFKYKSHGILFQF